MTNKQKEELYALIKSLYESLCDTMPDGALDATLCSHIELFCNENKIVIQDSYSLLIDFYCEYAEESL